MTLPRWIKILAISTVGLAGLCIFNALNLPSSTPTTDVPPGQPFNIGDYRVTVSPLVVTHALSVEGIGITGAVAPPGGQNTWS